MSPPPRRENLPKPFVAPELALPLITPITKWQIFSVYTFVSLTRLRAPVQQGLSFTRLRYFRIQSLVINSTIKANIYLHSLCARASYWGLSSHQ